VAGIVDFKNVYNFSFPAGVVKTDSSEVDLFLILYSTTPARHLYFFTFDDFVVWPPLLKKFPARTVRCQDGKLFEVKADEEIELERL